MASFTVTANYDSDCDLDVPQEFEGVDFRLKTKNEKAQIHSGYQRLNAGQYVDTGSADIILETNPVVLQPVMRIIWRSVRYQSTVTFVYSDEEEGQGAARCQEESANGTSATSE